MIIVTPWEGLDVVDLSDHPYWCLFETPDGRVFFEVAEDMDAFLQAFLVRCLDGVYPVIAASDDANLLMSRCVGCGDPVVDCDIVVNAVGVLHARCVEGGE